MLLVYLALALITTQVFHFSLALDEGYHLEYITFIKQNGRLPTTYEERSQITRADFPPLYQVLVALLSANVSVDGPPNFKYFWDSFRYRAIDHQADQVGALKTEDFQPPYLGRFLVWQIGRWFSIVLSATTLGVVFLTLQELPLGPKPLVPLAGTALLAFMPRYIILGAALNDDNLLGLLAALYFWLLIKAIKSSQRWWPFIGLGILVGLSMTVKYTLVLVPLELGAICALIANQKKWGWRWVGARLGVIAGLSLLCSSWWFGWNLWFLNTVARDGWLGGLLSPLLAGGSDTTLNRISGFLSGGQIGLADLPENTKIGTFSGWMISTFLSFWGVSIGDSIPWSPYVYLVIVLFVGVTGFGLWRLWCADSSSRQWLLLLSFHTAIFIILPLVRFGLSRRLGQTAQGRHILIPAAAAVVGLLVWGLTTAIPQRWQRWVFPLLIVGLLSWTGAHLYRLVTFAVSPLPLRTLPQAAEWLAQPVEAKFGDEVELVSYELDPQPGQGLLHLNLAWRSLAYTKESYLVKVELLDQQSQVVSHWLGYNGQGRLPTLAWDPGDTVFDRLALPLPNLPAGEYTVQLQLVSHIGALPVAQQEGRRAGGQESHSTSSLLLASMSLAQPSTLSLPQYLSLVTPAGPLDLAFSLWRSDGPIETSPAPTYRYPATISIVTSDSLPDGISLDLQLVDATGQTWVATQNQANIYTFVIGPRWPSGDYRLQATLQRGDEVVGQVTGEPLLTVENWWQRHFDVPQMAVSAEANFADQFKFLGYTLPHNQVKAGEAFPLTLYWQALPNRSPQADFIQFNHLLDNAGALRGGYDRHPLEYYSTLLWAPGEVVIDGYAVPVNPDALPGQYYLSVGYYLTVGESAVNLPLVQAGQMTNVTSVSIGPIEVVKP